MHTRSTKVEEVLNFVCTLFTVIPLDKFSPGKRASYGMIKMSTRDDAWALIRRIKDHPTDFMGFKLWATRSYPKKERERTSGLRRVAWAIRKAVNGGPLPGMDVVYTKLRLFLGDHMVGCCAISTSEFLFDESGWVKAVPSLSLQKLKDILKEAFLAAGAAAAASS